MQTNDKWIINIKQELDTLGLNDIWQLSYVGKSIYVIIKERLFDVFWQLCFSNNFVKDFFIINC